MINGSSSEVIGIQYDSLYQINFNNNEYRDFFKSRYIVKNGENYKLIDLNGNEIFQDNFEYIEQLNVSSNYFKVKKNDKYGIITSDNKILLNHAVRLHDRNVICLKKSK